MPEQSNNKYLVTGGSGFIGSAVVRHLIGRGDDVLNVDKLTYAANPASLADIENAPTYRFAQADICDAGAMQDLFADYQPDFVMHLAAESHVDRSIDGAGPFIETNVVGTWNMLEVATAFWRSRSEAKQEAFRFLHISTDEVYGALGDEGYFTNQSPHRPNSPYAASKASADHLARAWCQTHGLPVIVSNCSNNYGPYQFPEKLIPLMILKGLAGEPLPVYGDGSNVRDWMHVDDHVQALMAMLEKGQPGEVYLVGGDSERTNIDVVDGICDLLDEYLPDSKQQPHRDLRQFVTDRPGHDFRYAIDSTRAHKDLGWRPQESFESGLAKTVRWYLDNESWWQPILDGRYQGQRLGKTGEEDTA
ncbi:MAG: dTDP-glucose 4,6-dehydratase [Alphaproteobacteria bacterium]|jgi:dTDP-glucose 4,6-dehydratase|nr:dTDP-glucose 4,6-dehydratase [Alphaproteobacteria bacterium]MBT4017142.1 dTDP-glucose 4,6-dehydratase [Alphaproteobacteria bacterium]MBT4966228.1 dTDP-glucose 4,6-dehydratase [Alphaproteobacteria bacterium]MBT5159701.1 dTDP-glucose 4,6-dehydratase [Alphaproteobacteria bacterium]MBT5918336.1 dTDP-glucose 4,6-dehydratase [Alphaproteobacteria bacterium]